MLANRGVTSDYIHRVPFQRHTKLNQVELDKEKYSHFTVMQHCFQRVMT